MEILQKILEYAALLLIIFFVIAFAVSVFIAAFDEVHAFRHRLSKGASSKDKN